MHDCLMILNRHSSSYHALDLVRVYMYSLQECSCTLLQLFMHSIIYSHAFSCVIMHIIFTIRFLFFIVVHILRGYSHLFPVCIIVHFFYNCIHHALILHYRSQTGVQVICMFINQ